MLSYEGNKTANAGSSSEFYLNAHPMKGFSLLLPGQKKQVSLIIIKIILCWYQWSKQRLF